MGATFDGKVREGVIYRLNKASSSPVKYQYLVVSDNVEGSADIVTVRDFRRVREKLKKRVKKGIGLEITIGPVRKMDAVGVGKWFEHVAELHSFCLSSSCQLILSSGASSMQEMVAGPSLDAILRTCNIDPEKYWREMNLWLKARLSKRVSIQC